MVYGPLIVCFTDYLKNHQQRVVIDNSCSTFCPVSSGVPQGSILGPLLFLIFINDLPHSVCHGSSVALFADDSQCFRPISSSAAAVHLQIDISSLNQWSIRNDLLFNISKCDLLSITRKREPTKCSYKLEDDEISQVKSCKYLGVTITNKLQWRKQVTVATRRATKNLNMVKRISINNLDIFSKRSLYLALVRSHLGYARVRSGHLISIKIW